MAQLSKAMNMTPIIEGNKLIAEFMGERVNKYHESTFPENMKYHSDWSVLMAVVEKIVRIHYVDDLPDYDYPYLRTFGMTDSETGFYMVRFNRQQLFIGEKLIDATWYAVVDFIKWFNSQPKTQSADLLTK